GGRAHQSRSPVSSLAGYRGGAGCHEPHIAARRPLGGSCGADGTCQSAPFVTLRERRHQYNWGEAQGGDPPMALWRRKSKQVNDVAPPVDVEIVEPVPIAPDDPLLDYLQKLAR